MTWLKAICEVTMAKVTGFPELMQLRLPPGSNEALDKLAELQRQTRSESIRQCLFRELRAHGIARLQS